MERQQQYYAYCTALRATVCCILNFLEWQQYREAAIWRGNSVVMPVIGHKGMLLWYDFEGFTSGNCQKLLMNIALGIECEHTTR